MTRSIRRTKEAAPARRLTARIEGIAAGGDGVAIVDGARLYVPLTAPGDLTVIDARGERGELVELIEESPVRAAPPCIHYGQCGGCALQHVTGDYYRQWKRERVASNLSRAGVVPGVIAPTIETPAASRRRATFAVRKKRGGVLIGFNARRSARIAEIENCIVLHPELLARLPALRSLAGLIDAPSFDLSATLCDNGLDIDIIAKGAAPPRGPETPALIGAARAAGAERLSFNEEPIVTLAPPLVHFDGIAVTPPPGGFLQASREGEAALIGLVKEAAGPAKKIADLFSGCGTFALPLARGATVFAIDADRAAIAALARAAGDAQRSGLNIHPVQTEARNLFERPVSAKDLKSFDAVVFDPPRAGAAAQSAEIANSGAKVVIGVSCNPATFARDAAIVVAGGYTLSQVTPVDQFVYSPHVELVGVFRKS